MKDELALRYLLLRHLEPFEPALPRDDFLEIVRSLHVEADREGYSVSWFAGGVAQSRAIPRDEFRFYTRGDRAVDAGAIDADLSNANDARARAFAEEVFGRPTPVRPGLGAEPLEPHRGVAMAGAVVLGAALWWAGFGAGPALGLSLWVLAEFAPRGRLVACGPLLLLAAVGPAAAALLGALAMTALQGLDPDTRGRRLRIALSAVAVGLASLRVGAEDGTLGGGAVLLAAVALGMAVHRSLFTVHARAVPLALPFYWMGLALVSLPAACVGLALSALEELWSALGHRVLPVRGGR